MKDIPIELILLISLEFNHKELKLPTKYPYWENQDLWYEYRKASLKMAGFTDEMKPYFKGAPFYEPKAISEENLKKIVLDHTEDFRNGKYERDQTYSLLGGFVLKKDQEDKFFPQCCGELTDIQYWENVSNANDAYYEGHPAPRLSFKSNKVIFNFSVQAYDEIFQPTPPNPKLIVQLNDLKSAVDKAKIDLQKLSDRVIKINQMLNLGIEEIEDLLIWRNSNY